MLVSVLSEARDRGPITAAAQRRGVPKGFQSGAHYDTVKGTASVVVREIPEDERGWREHIAAQTGMTVPDDQEVTLTGVRTWTMGAHENKHLTFRIAPRSASGGTVDIASLLKIARANAKSKPPRLTDVAATQTRIVGLSDEQIGKVDRRGGTDAFFARVGHLLGELDAEMRARPCEDAVILLGGDLVEGFENTPQQAFTNDLSHPEMLRVARAYLTEAITRIASRHERTRVLAVPSNHGAWRRGKDNLGKPADDYGLDVSKAVAEALNMSERWSSVQFIFPEPWEVSLAVPVRDDVVALTHGHIGTTGTAESFRRWFLNQVAGDSPIARSSLIYHGHYHNFQMYPLGSIDGRERWSFQLPALDGGSSWFTNVAGDTSRPGIFTHVIVDGGGIDHLRILTVPQ